MAMRQAKPLPATDLRRSKQCLSPTLPRSRLKHRSSESVAQGASRADQPGKLLPATVGRDGEASAKRPGLISQQYNEGVGPVIAIPARANDPTLSVVFW